MKFCYTLQEIRDADAKSAERGTPTFELMERAGAALSERLSALMRERHFSDVLFVCGGGNNGGDGFVAARRLKEEGREVAVLCLAKKFTPDCAAAAKRYGGEVFGRIPRRRFLLIVDCVLGSGLRSAPEGDGKTLIEFINSSGAYVVSCDLPSGLTENGIACSPCVRADETVTIGALKHALLMADGADFAGKITVAEIGLTPEGGACIFEDADVGALFPKRQSHVHKGTFGSACIFAGGALYSGAAFLAAGACLKSGVGYTRLAVIEPLYSHAIGKLPAAILSEFRAVDGVFLSSDCIAMGMGAGVNERVFALIVELLPKYTGTLVLDADALNALSAYGVEVLKEKSCRVIVTPHIGEFARLVRKEKSEVLQNAAELAAQFAKEYGVTVVLKNNRTLITDGERMAINLTGSPALAKGGSGDVLSGLLAGTCGRGIAPFEASCAASYLLGRAGELAAADLGEYAVDGSDLIRYLPAAIKSVTERP